jgi:amidase
MAIRHPTLEELAGIAKGYHLNPTVQDLESFQALMAPTLQSYVRLEQLTEPTLPVKYPRKPGLPATASGQPARGLVLVLRHQGGSEWSAGWENRCYQG